MSLSASRPYAADWRYPWSRDAQPDPPAETVRLPSLVGGEPQRGDVPGMRGEPATPAGAAADSVDGACGAGVDLGAVAAAGLDWYDVGALLLGLSGVAVSAALAWGGAA